MCDISGISTGDLDWEDAINERNGSIAELNGRKYKMTVLEENATFSGAIYKSEPHGYTLRHRSVTNGEIKPLETGGSGSGNIKWEWGDKDGSKISAGVAAEVYNERGDYAKIEVKHNTNGKGSAEVTAGHKEGK